MSKNYDLILYAILAGIIFVIIMLLFNNVDKTIDYCSAKGGVLVESTEGYTCIDRKVVIK